MTTNLKINTNSRHHSYTMIELIGVMAILAILMAIGLGITMYARRAAADGQTKALVKRLEMANESYKNKFGYYMPQLHTAGTADSFYTDKISTTPIECFNQFIDFEELKGANLLRPSDSTLANQAICTYYFFDGFGNPIYYRNPGVNNRGKYDIWSKGADGDHDLTTPKINTSSDSNRDNISNF